MIMTIAKYINRSGADVALTPDPCNPGRYAVWDCGKQQYIERGIERQEATLRIQRGDYPYVYRAAEEAGLVRDWPYDFHR